MEVGDGYTRRHRMHPLDPLSADEIRQAVATLRRERELAPTFRFACVTLEEPAKAWLAAWDGAEVSAAPGS